MLMLRDGLGESQNDMKPIEGAHRYLENELRAFSLRRLPKGHSFIHGHRRNHQPYPS